MTEIVGLAQFEFHERGVNWPPTHTPNLAAIAPGCPVLRKHWAGTSIAAGQEFMIWSLPVISYSSLTLTLVFDHFKSYQLSVRIRRNAACDFSPWASAGPIAAIVTASPAANPRAQSLPAWRLAWRASDPNIVVVIGYSPTRQRRASCIAKNAPFRVLSGPCGGELDGLHVFSGGEHLTDIPPDEIHDNRDEPGEERRDAHDILTEGTHRAAFDNSYVFGHRGTNVVEADDVGQAHQRAILLGRLMVLRKDHPIVRIEEQREAHRADNRGNDKAPAEQQHDVKEKRLRDQRGRPDEVDRIEGPAPEADVAVEPFAEEKGDTKECRAERQPEMLPEEILGGRREGNQHDRQDGRPHAPVLRVDPEVPVAHGQHGVDMIAADHDQKEKRQDQKIGCPDGIRCLGAGMERRTHRRMTCVFVSRRRASGGGRENRIRAGAAFDARRRRDRFGRRSRSGLN